jgi:hypothetical protein
MHSKHHISNNNGSNYKVNILETKNGKEWTVVLPFDNAVLGQLLELAEENNVKILNVTSEEYVLNIGHRERDQRHIKQIKNLPKTYLQWLRHPIDAIVTEVKDMGDTFKDIKNDIDSIENPIKIGNAGAKVVASFLAKNPGLEELNLSENDIGDDGAKSLAKSLTTNSNLRKLNLFGNPITPLGYQRFESVLENQTTLTSIVFSDDVIKNNNRRCYNHVADNKNLPIVFDQVITNIAEKTIAKAILLASVSSVAAEEFSLGSHFPKEVLSLICNNMFDMAKSEVLKSAEEGKTEAFKLKFNNKYNPSANIIMLYNPVTSPKAITLSNEVICETIKVKHADKIAAPQQPKEFECTKKSTKLTRSNSQVDMLNERREREDRDRRDNGGKENCIIS